MAKRTDQAFKIIAASPERLYRALSDPKELIAWLPPNGMSGRFEYYDFSVNGGYSMVLTYEAKTARSAGKSSDTTDIVDGRFGEIEPNRRIVQLIDFQSDDPAFAGTMTMTWTLEPVANGTEVRIVAENVPDGISAEDHAEGLRSSLDNLTDFVA